MGPSRGGGAARFNRLRRAGLFWRASQGARRRLSEDAVASRVVLRALAEGCGCVAAARKLDLDLCPAPPNGVRPAPDRGSLDGSAASASFEHLQACARTCHPAAAPALFRASSEPLAGWLASQVF
jgi:hypothetical protein